MKALLGRYSRATEETRPPKVTPERGGMDVPSTAVLVALWACRDPSHSPGDSPTRSGTSNEALRSL